MFLILGIEKIGVIVSERVEEISGGYGVKGLSGNFF